MQLEMGHFRMTLIVSMRPDGISQSLALNVVGAPTRDEKSSFRTTFL